MRTVVTIEVPIEHRFAVGDVIARPEPPPDEQRSVWRIVEVGCSYAWAAPWYRLEPVNEIAMVKVIRAHARAVNANPAVVGQVGPVTEHITTVDRQCEPHR